MRVKVWPTGIMKVEGSKVRGSIIMKLGLWWLGRGFWVTLGGASMTFLSIRSWNLMTEAHAVIGIMAMGLVVGTKKGFVEIWG